MPDRKTTCNRLHIDVHASGGRDLPIETRKKRVDAEALRLCDLGATLLSDLSEELEDGVDHYAVALKTPRATSSTSTDGRPGAIAALSRARGPGRG